MIVEQEFAVDAIFAANKAPERSCKHLGGDDDGSGKMTTTLYAQEPVSR
jgi:hypothetical protein